MYTAPVYTVVVFDIIFIILLYTLFKEYHVAVHQDADLGSFLFSFKLRFDSIFHGFTLTRDLTRTLNLAGPYALLTSNKTLRIL